MTVVLRWRALATEIARRYELDAGWVLAVIATESGGVPGAVRVERGFLTRYLQRLAAAVRASASTADDRWWQYPDLYSASYGLMQVLYPVALEVGMSLQYPTDLCDPATGIEAGCRVLVRAGARGADAAGWRAALLRYNGGGDPGYPDRVAQWRTRLATG